MKRNLKYAFVAQLLALLVSATMLLVVAKYLSVEEYSYWQFFIMCTQYVSVFQFGIAEGIYLRTKETDINNLDKNKITFQFYFLIVVQILLAIIIGAFVFFTNNIEVMRKGVLLSAILYMMIFNVAYYLRLLFQTINSVVIYSKSVIIEKGFYIIALFGLLILAVSLGLIYCVYYMRRILFVKLKFDKSYLCEIKNNIFAGANLLLSNMSAGVVLVIARVIADYRWGIIGFGKFSLAISLSNFFLGFINQISIVLFPGLKNLKQDDLTYKYQQLRAFLNIFLPIIFIGYFPIKWILQIYLPQYNESFMYLGFILPICMFDGKMQMLFNTFLKILRKEKSMLLINIFTVILCGMGSLIGAYVLNDIYIIIISMVTSIAVRSIITEIYINNFINVLSIKSILTELSLAIIFVIIVNLHFSLIGLITYLIIYILYIVINKEQLKIGVTVNSSTHQ